MYKFIIPINTQTLPPVCIGAIEVTYIFEGEQGLLPDGLLPTIHTATFAGCDLLHLLDKSVLVDAAINNYLNR